MAEVAEGEGGQIHGSRRGGEGAGGGGMHRRGLEGNHARSYEVGRGVGGRVSRGKEEGCKRE